MRESLAGTARLAELIAFAQRVAAARAPGVAYYHPGDFVWQLYAAAEPDDVAIWRRDGEIAGVAIFEPPANVQIEVQPLDAPSLLPEAIDWAEARRRGLEHDTPVPAAYAMLGDGTLATTALDGDETRIETLLRRGYVRNERHTLRFARALGGELSGAMVPDGAIVRAVRDGEVEERAELHRDAWSVWGESSFSAEAYRRLRAAPLYDPELDLVVEHDGRLVSYCVCWLDAANGTGYFEPVGTRPSAAGRGFGRAVVLEGMRRMRERGMRVATVQTASVNAAAEALYRSAGFDVVAREHFYVKRM